MKYLGIDFGEKRVGIAISDDTGRMAFPNVVLENTPKLLEEVIKIIKDENVDGVVIGESKNFAGEPNKIMALIHEFVKNLNEEAGIKVLFEPEFLTSHQAERWQGKNDLHDASAAAIILQSYLDRLK